MRVRGVNQWAVSLAALACLATACRSGGSGSKDDPSPAGEAAKADPGAEKKTPDPPVPPPDPERADKLRDLDELCAALDHDYVDGTLSDYYAKVEMRTEWGKAQRAAGDESIQPGRLLEKAVAELSPGAEDPQLEHCRKLLDYLDDVE